MTIKDRARVAMRGTGCGRALTDDDLIALREFIEQALRDQIEECARVADVEREAREIAEKSLRQCGKHFNATLQVSAINSAQAIAATIRALAGIEPSFSIEDRFRPSGFWFP